MSIAVSAVIQPSRRVGRFCRAFACANLVAGLSLAAGWAGAFRHPYWLAAACLLGAAVLLAPGLAGPEMRRIDISGLGQIRLTVQQDMGLSSAPGVLVDLLPGSTLWPGMLVLRLGAGSAVSVLLVLPDSISDEQFRGVAVAVSDISVRKNKFSKNNKIL
ncbi:MAG: flagellar hook-length control protein [Massilia sp.]